ncbi:MAG: hypothetical protein ACRD4I_09620, partial [Candidatus Angelobacter sp.]
MNVAGLIANLLDGRMTRANAKVRVRYKAVLRYIETHSHRRGIARSNFKINIGDRTVKGKFAGVSDR